MKTAKTAPDALKLLWQQKYFMKPRTLKTVEAELQKQGFNFVDKNLMMALKSARFLTRKGEKGKYLYVQKHPYIEGE